MLAGCALRQARRLLRPLAPEVSQRLEVSDSVWFQPAVRSDAFSSRS